MQTGGSAARDPPYENPSYAFRVTYENPSYVCARVTR